MKTQEEYIIWILQHTGLIAKESVSVEEENVPMTKENISVVPIVKESVSVVEESVPMTKENISVVPIVKENVKVVPIVKKVSAKKCSTCDFQIGKKWRVQPCV